MRLRVGLALFRARHPVVLLIVALLVVACGSTPRPSRHPPVRRHRSRPSVRVRRRCSLRRRRHARHRTMAGVPRPRHPTVIPLVITSQAWSAGRPASCSRSSTRENRPVAAPDRTASVAFYNLGRSPPSRSTTVDATFVWAIEDERGIYIANVDLPAAGVWGAEFTTAAPGSPRETIRVEVRRPRSERRRSLSATRRRRRTPRPLPMSAGT